MSSRSVWSATVNNMNDTKSNICDACWERAERVLREKVWNCVPAEVYDHVVVDLARRFQRGDRLRALYDAIMALER